MSGLPVRGLLVGCVVRLDGGLSGGADLLADRPDKARKLAGDRHRDLVTVQPARVESTKPRAQAWVAALGSPVWRRAMTGLTAGRC
jgi:hypothetical protein